MSQQESCLNCPRYPQDFLLPQRRPPSFFDFFCLYIDFVLFFSCIHGAWLFAQGWVSRHLGFPPEIPEFVCALAVVYTMTVFTCSVFLLCGMAGAAMDKPDLVYFCRMGFTGSYAMQSPICLYSVFRLDKFLVDLSESGRLKGAFCLSFVYLIYIIMFDYLYVNATRAARGEVRENAIIGLVKFYTAGFGPERRSDTRGLKKELSQK